MQVQQLINAINQLKGFDRTKNQEPKKKRTDDENKNQLRDAINQHF